MLESDRSAAVSEVGLEDAAGERDLPGHRDVLGHRLPERKRHQRRDLSAPQDASAGTGRRIRYKLIQEAGRSQRAASAQPARSRVAIVIPAEGPSLGVAPSGMCMCTSGGTAARFFMSKAVARGYDYGADQSTRHNCLLFVSAISLILP